VPFSNKIMQKSAARLFMLLCSYALFIFSRTDYPFVAGSGQTLSELIRFLQAFGFPANLSLFADAGDYNPAEEIHL
jgi:hypothetical protein